MIEGAVRRLAAAGCIAPNEEAAELVEAAAGDPDRLRGFIERRTTGEPLAWITGSILFCGCRVVIDPGVYVPRWQSEPLAERAAALLPPDGRAIDLGTGSGAIARVLLDRRPGASVLGTEVDPLAARCARRNGIEVVEGDLFAAVPESWRGSVDVIVAVLPYVPTGAFDLLPRDVRTFEPRVALDGGDDGLALVRRAVAEAAGWVREGDHLLLEVGGSQPGAVEPMLAAAHFEVARVIHDAEGGARGIEAVAQPSLKRSPRSRKRRSRGR